MDDIKKLSFEELTDKAVKITKTQEDLEAGLKVLKDELADRLREMKITGRKVGNWYVSRVKRISTTDVLLSVAKELGATTEKIDSAKISALIAKGVKITGVKYNEFVGIREAKGGDK